MAYNLTTHHIFKGEKGKCWHNQRQLRKAKSNLILKEQLPFHFPGTLSNMTVIVKFFIYNLKYRGEE